ncbi:MAG: hypothetical protein IH985_09575, partial [Planctomycetes bacterium]|nr:hypothetical protein [Planctomycetota bacterium]
LIAALLLAGVRTEPARGKLLLWLGGFSGAAARREARRRVAPPFAPVNAGHPLGLTARQQIDRARARVAETRKRAHERAHRRSRGARKEFSTNPNPGVAVVVMGFIGLAVLAGGALIAAALLMPGPSGLVVRKPSMPDLPRSEAAAASVVVGPGDVRISTPGDAPVKLPDQVSTLLTGRRAIVLRETSAFEPGAVREIDVALTDLFNRGMDLIGYVPAGVHVAPGVDDTDLVADLRVEVGVAPWRSPSAQGAIEGWLKAHDDIDAVIWIARDPRNEKRASIWSVPSPRLDDGTLDTLVDVLGSGRD